MKNKGITLIALIVTVIILIILSGVSIKLLTDNGGIIGKTREAAFKQELAQYKEAYELYKVMAATVEDTWDTETVSKMIGGFQYKRKIGVVNQKISFLDQGNEKENKWAREVGYQIISEKVTIRVDVIGRGTVSGIEIGKDIEMYSGNKLKLNAVPEKNKLEDTTIFIGWYKDGEFINKENEENKSYEFEITKDEKITAIFGTDNTRIYYLGENNEEKIFETNDTIINSSTYSATIPDKTKITKLELGKSCTEIQTEAFKDAINMKFSYLPSTVTKIGKEAFYGCTGIKEIYATANELNIDSAWIFSECSNLETVYFQNVKMGETRENVAQFESCTNLKNVILGSKDNPITEVPYLPFNNCSDKKLLIKIYLQETDIDKFDNFNWVGNNNTSTIELYNVEGILQEARLGTYFAGNTEINWTNWSDIELDGEKIGDKIISLTSGQTSTENLTRGKTIIPGVFEGCINLALTDLSINEKLTVIPDNTFKGCTNLETTNIPKNIIKLGNYAFSGCTNLTSIASDKYSKLNIESLYTFSNCSNLKKVDFPNVYMGISPNAIAQFEACTSLKNVILGSKDNPIAEVSYLPFNCCSDKKLLIKIYLKENDIDKFDNFSWVGTNNTSTVEIYDSTGGNLQEVRLGTYFAENTEINWTNWSDIELNGEKIGDKIILLTSGQTSTENLTRGKTIIPGVFEGCINLALTDLSINEKLTVIPDNTFKGCTNLSITDIPKNVTKLGNYAFAKCANLTEISDVKVGESRNEPLDIASYYVFSDCTKLTNIKFTNSIFTVIKEKELTYTNFDQFCSCKNLENVEIISNNITTDITGYIFQGCTKLKEKGIIFNGFPISVNTLT